jgi:hypothetical protein
MSKSHAAMCVYCGEAVIYDTREVTDMAAAHAKIVEHDQQCPRNPLVSRIAHLEQLTSDRLELVTATTDRALALETALAESTRILREILQGEKLQFSRRIQICSWADHLDALTNMEAPHG